jgi:cyanobactin maturation PatA/PatG family protease
MGDPRILIAVVDGPVDRSHASLRGAKIEQHFSPDAIQDESLCSFGHGTEVASVIFGQHDTGLRGVAPGCRGISIPVFACSPSEFASTDQKELAQAVHSALQRGAHVINISAGQLGSHEDAEPDLRAAIRDCAASGVLVVAAAGNDGCDCLHLPAALPDVLPVGAMSFDGIPLPSSNWGAGYRAMGILAPGLNVLVASAAGGVERQTGTSYAAAIVSGVAGLLLSRQLRLGRPADPLLVREAFLRTAIACDDLSLQHSRRCLAGRLNIPGAISFLDDRSPTMTNDTLSHTSDPAAIELPEPVGEQPGVARSGAERSIVASAGGNASGSTQYGQRNSAPETPIEPSACAACRGERQLVYALGQLGHDFGTEATLDAFKQRMRNVSEQHASPYDERHLLHFLEQKCDKEPWHATSVLWTLWLSGMPQYVIRPEGPYARECYARLREYYREQVYDKVERVAVPGRIAGQATLLNGRTVPVIEPDLRGFCNWSPDDVVKAVMDCPGKTGSKEEISQALKSFLDRVYHEMQNAGLAPQDRALNYAGTNLFQCREILSSLDNRKTLDAVSVERSKVHRPASDCWDITLSFFDPQEPLQTVRKVYRYTVDVSDVIPVTIGEVRSWAARTL